jgi:hypothetical protein
MEGSLDDRVREPHAAGPHLEKESARIRDMTPPVGSDDDAQGAHDVQA